MTVPQFDLKFERIERSSDEPAIRYSAHPVVEARHVAAASAAIVAILVFLLAIMLGVQAMNARVEHRIIQATTPEGRR